MNRSVNIKTLVLMFMPVLFIVISPFAYSKSYSVLEEHQSEPDKLDLARQKDVFSGQKSSSSILVLASDLTPSRIYYASAKGNYQNETRKIIVGRYSFSTNAFVGADLARKKRDIKITSDKIRSVIPKNQKLLRNKRVDLKAIKITAQESSALLSEFTSKLLFEGKSVSLGQTAAVSPDSLQALYMRLQADSSKTTNNQLLSALLDLQKKLRQLAAEAQARSEENQQSAGGNDPAGDLAEAVDNLLEEAGNVVNQITDWLGL